MFTRLLHIQHELREFLLNLFDHIIKSLKIKFKSIVKFSNSSAKPCNRILFTGTICNLFMNQINQINDMKSSPYRFKIGTKIVLLFFRRTNISIRTHEYKIN